MLFNIIYLFLFLNTATFNVTGLTCSMCSFSVQKGLEKIDAIEKIEPNLEDTSFIVTFKDGVFIDLFKIENAVLDAGFFIDKKSFKKNFKNNSNFDNWIKDKEACH